jgi:hypothetical protein
MMMTILTLVTMILLLPQWTVTVAGLQLSVVVITFVAILEPFSVHAAIAGPVAIPGKERCKLVNHVMWRAC